jgi:hypothetical protein
VSKFQLAIGVNCCAILLALPLAVVACVGVDFGRGDAAPGLAPKPPLTALENLDIVAWVMGIAALAALPSVVLLSFRKTGAGLIAACAPFVTASVMLWSVRNAFL